MKQIPLTRGYFALVDDVDFEWLSKFKWVSFNDRGRIYAVRNVEYGKTTLKMHRQIMGLEDPNIIIDHADLNCLNNQRSNLRICTKSQNASNRAVDKRTKSGYKGVSWHRQSSKWRAYITVNYRQKSLGLYDCPTTAAKAYDKAAIELHGTFANLNFPEQTTAP